MIYSDSAHYEAQQMLKTIYHRHKAKKQLQESYSVLAVSVLTVEWTQARAHTVEQHVQPWYSLMRRGAAPSCWVAMRHELYCCWP